MTDWADEMAGKAGLKLHWGHKHDCEIIATYLRKAKADGMREAAETVETHWALEREPEDFSPAWGIKQMGII